MIEFVQGEQVPSSLPHAAAAPKRSFLGTVSHVLSSVRLLNELWGRLVILSAFSFIPNLCCELFSLGRNESFSKICLGFRRKMSRRRTE